MSLRCLDNVVFVPYLADDKAETLDALLRGEKHEEDSKSSTCCCAVTDMPCSTECIDQWMKDGTGLLAHKFVIVIDKSGFQLILF